MSSSLEKPKISVIIPSYNSGNYIEEAIKSVINQTYKNLEIIIVNDGSIDDTESIAKKWAKRDERVHYLKHSSNKGLSAARNTGISSAKGEYIALLDADDVWQEDKLEKQLKRIYEKETLVFSDAELVDENSEPKGYTIWEGVDVNPCRDANCLKKLFRKNFVIPASSILLPKKVWEKVDGFDERLKSIEDYDFILRVLNNGTLLNYVETPLLYYRSEGDRMSSNSIKMEYWRIYVLFKFLKNNPRFLVKNPVLATSRLLKRLVAFLVKKLHLYHE